MPWLQLLYGIVKDPKNICIIILAGLLIFFYIKSGVYKSTIVSQQVKIESLTSQTKTLTLEKDQLQKNNISLIIQSQEKKKIEKNYNDLQAKITELKKICPQTIKIKEPSSGILPRTETIKLKEVKNETEKEEKTEKSSGTAAEIPKETEKEPVEQVGNSTEKIVDYQWGGTVYEQKAISIYNELVNSFNSD